MAKILNRKRRFQYAIVTIAFLVLTRMPGTLPIYRDTLLGYLDIGDNVFGFIFSMSSLGAISVLIGGAYTDRYGPRKVIRFCLTGISIAFFCFALAGNRWGMIALGMALYGLFHRPLGIAISNYLIRLFPDNKRRALSLNMAGSNAGALFYPSIAEGFLGLSKSFTSISFAAVFHIPFAAVGALIMAGGFLYRKRTSLGVHTTVSKRLAFRDISIPRRYLPIIFFMLLHGLADGIFVFWLPRYLGSGAFDSVLIGPGYIITGHSIAYMLSRIVIGMLPEHIGRKLFLVLPGILGGGVFIAGILSGNYLITAGAYVLGSFLWSAEYPAMLGLLGHEIPKKFGAALALHALLGATSMFFVHNIMGFIFNSLPVESYWQAIIVPAAFFPCVGIGCAIWLTKTGCYWGRLRVES